MKKHRIVLVVSLAFATMTFAQSNERRATIRGGNPNEGKCTIEVVVDGTAEVAIRGDGANLRTLAGQPAQWRRFECSAPMPMNPNNFRFAGVDGRGRQELIRPAANGQPAVIRIDDPKNGSEGYTFDVFWNGGGGGGGGFPPRFGQEDAIRVCKDSVLQQASDQFRTRDVDIRRIAIDDNRGRNDWVTGILDVRRGGGRESFRFSCSVDFQSGRVRSATIDPMGPPPDRGPSPTTQALQVCQDRAQERLRSDGWRRVEIHSVRVDDQPGRNDWVVGRATADRGNGPREWGFSCDVDLRSGDVRSVDVRPVGDSR